VIVRTFTNHPESCQGRTVPTRVNEPAWKTTWSAFHRAKTSAPRRPFERPARASPGSAAWPPRCRSSTPFNSRVPPCGDLREPGPRPRARLPAGSRFSEPGRRSPTSATDVDARAHPVELSVLAREWGFHPATRWHQPMPVALAFPPRCRVEGRRAALCTPRLSHGVFHLRGRSSLRGSRRSREGRCARS